MSVGGFVHQHIYTIDGGGTPGDGTVTSVTVDSPNDTIDVTNGNVTTAGTIEIDVTGLPPADATTTLGSNAVRWNGVVVTGIGSFTWRTAVGGHSNTASYQDGTGPFWFDGTTGKDLFYNVQSLTASRTATWQDSDGTVAWLTDTTDALGDLYTAPSLVTLNHTTGGTFTASPGVPGVVFITSDNAGSIVGTTAIDANPGDLTLGWEFVVTFIVAATTITHSSIFTATGALALETSAIAGQSFRYIWDTNVSKYKRYV